MNDWDELYLIYLTFTVSIVTLIRIVGRVVRHSMSDACSLKGYGAGELIKVVKLRG